MILQSNSIGDSISILSEIWNNFVVTLPNILKALVVLIIGYIIAKVVAGIIRKLFEKIGIDKLGEKLNEIEIVSKANMEIKPSSIFSKIVYYVLMLIFTLTSAEILGIDAISELFRDIINFIPKLIVALIVLLFGILLADMVKKLVYTACNSLGIPSANLISSFLFYFLFVNVVIMALSQAEIDTAFISSNISILIAGAVAAFAIGYGFASKDVVGNFIASFYTKDLFQVGDQVIIDGEEGVIVDVDRSSITIQNGDYRTIIPLGKTVSDKIKIKNR